MDSSLYGDETVLVEHVETHISHVFLSNRFVYKLKKRVNFEFLSFETIEQREEACRNEYRLNQRLAPGVYLDVLPITLVDGRLRLDGSGEAVDWIVKMVRLPADRTMDELIRRGSINDEMVQGIADHLVAFYQSLSPLAFDPEEYQSNLERNIRGNQAELDTDIHGFDRDAVQALHEAQRHFILLMPELLRARVREGRIVEGHGDLKPEHVYCLDTPTIIDCIEFNERFRQIDIADELAFLSVECAALDAPRVGEQILACYSAATGDHVPARLLDLYRSYRASVRAKVLALRAEQEREVERKRELERAARYLSLAGGYAKELAAPVLVIVRGLSGTGKSRLAGLLAERVGAAILRTDEIRESMFPTGTRSSEYGSGIYQEDRRDQVYQEMFRRAEDYLRRHRWVILDGTFLRSDLRWKSIQLADRNGAASVILRCRCPDEIAAMRIAGRRRAGIDPSEAFPEILVDQRVAEEPDPAGAASFDIDTSDSPETAVQDAIEIIRQRVREFMDSRDHPEMED